MTDPIVFYDGHCGLCHRAVRALIALDARGVLRFAPLDGETAKGRTLPAADSLVIVTDDGRALVRLAALRHCLEHLGGPWRLLAGFLRLIPSGLGDRIYDLIAGNRHGWFAKPPASCPRLPPELRGRLLP